MTAHILTKNAKRVEFPKYKSVRHGYYSFTYNSAFIWNNLPKEIKQEFDIKIFKRLINNIMNHNVTLLHVKFVGYK